MDRGALGIKCTEWKKLYLLTWNGRGELLLMNSNYNIVDNGILEWSPRTRIILFVLFSFIYMQPLLRSLIASEDVSYKYFLKKFKQRCSLDFI